MKKKAFLIVLSAAFVVVIGVIVFLFIQSNNINKKIQGVWSLQSMDVGTSENRRTRDDAEFMMYIMKKIIAQFAILHQERLMEKCYH